MNERIRELVEKSYIYDKQNDSSFFNKELFAELIVRECCKVIVNGGYWSGGPLGPKRQCTPPEIANMVTEHFGVEE
jgi:hypothetical protein